jgi:pimeloyl-ACP methyl ester carboxylesterase
MKGRPTINRASVNGVELEFETTGAGPPVLLIHGGNVAREFEPLSRLPALTAQCLVVRYHRRGMGGSSPIETATTISDQAADAIGLLDHLEIDEAHVAGHSLGGVIALELAATAPDRVRSLALLEPILRDVPSAPSFFEDLAPVIEAYNSGRRAEAARGVFEFIGGPDWQDLVVVPGLLEDAVRDAPTFFEFERPALDDWSFDERRAANVTCPVLSVIGTESGIFFSEGRELLRSWFPQLQGADIAGATHFLESQDPDAVGRVLAEFVSDSRTEPAAFGLG